MYLYTLLRGYSIRHVERFGYFRARPYSGIRANPGALQNISVHVPYMIFLDLKHA